ncbi:MAG: radical SAM protein [Bacteroidetes bacterium]|nr:radical SAM protein [Bacteroidota bacterium]
MNRKQWESFYTVEQILEIVKKDRIFMEESGGGITISGGEPALQSTFSLELLKAFRSEGFHTAVDTSGFMSQSDFK